MTKLILYIVGLMLSMSFRSGFLADKTIKVSYGVVEIHEVGYVYYVDDEGWGWIIENDGDWVDGDRVKITYFDWGTDGFEDDMLIDLELMERREQE